MKNHFRVKLNSDLVGLESNDVNSDLQEILSVDLLHLDLSFRCQCVLCD